MNNDQLETVINAAWENRANLNPSTSDSHLRLAVDATLASLDAGLIRVAEKIGGEWVTHQWIKKAVLLSFRLNDNMPM